MIRLLPKHPVLTYVLIVLCFLIFLISPASGFLPTYGGGASLHRAQAAWFQRWGVLPYTMWDGAVRPILSPFTALFLHGSWLHLLGNVLFLFVFGGTAEQRMGRVRFALFYVGVGYLALLGYAVAHHDSTQTLVGASGADLRGARRLPLPLPEGPGHQPLPVPPLPAAALPRVDRADLLVRAPVAGRAGATPTGRASPTSRTWSDSPWASSTRGLRFRYGYE